MTFTERIHGDLRQAMKDKDALRLAALRMLAAAIKNREIENRGPLADDVVLKVIATLIKQREEAVELYTKGARPELAAKEQAEAVLLKAYLPAQLSAEELEHTVVRAIAEAGAVTAKDMGKVMKILVPLIAGRADAKQVSDAVRKKLT